MNDNGSEMHIDDVKRFSHNDDSFKIWIYSTIEYLTCLAGLHHLILWLIERKCLYFHCPTPLPGEGGTSAYAYEIVTRLPVLALVFYPAAAYRIMNHFFVMVGKINMLIHIFFRMELECHRYMT